MLKVEIPDFPVPGVRVSIYPCNNQLATRFPQRLPVESSQGINKPLLWLAQLSIDKLSNRIVLNSYNVRARSILDTIHQASVTTNYI